MHVERPTGTQCVINHLKVSWSLIFYQWSNSGAVDVCGLNGKEMENPDIACLSGAVASG